jgi:hypothetical protein
MCVSTDISKYSFLQNIILTGDFNCHDINWDTMTVNQDAQDKEIQRAVMEVVTANLIVQIHEQRVLS